ncbi:dihydrofolate reductase [Pseudosulfitobacter pseudonitzschiae]|uniref:dihydrofolate reductase n=1 Tax=Pseudosulfitobacter pseudonitzschiae TaxID=1402135 RepID=UPI003B7D5119
MITLIAARSRNGAIGKGGEIPWYFPEDLARFRRETIGGAVVMGRLTWDSLPRKPLEGRLNLVVTSRDIETVDTAPTVQEAMKHCNRTGFDRVYGVGGGGIYREMLPFSHRMLITEVNISVHGADAFFPDFDEADWIETGREDIRSNGCSGVTRELIRRDTTGALRP